MRSVWYCRWLAACMLALCAPAEAQSLDEELQQAAPAVLAEQARRDGDAFRGAVVFHQQYMACSKCHSVGTAAASLLGPDLTTIGSEVSDESLIESVLLPSKVIRRGYESATLLTLDGATLVGLLVERTDAVVTLREVARAGELTTIPTADIDQITINTVSLMPAGQVNQLAGRQQFLDLIRYLIEIRDGGASRARELQPPAALLAFTLPEYEERLDHAALIGDWDAAALERGAAIYQRVCANCHGTHDQPGSLPTSLRFAEGKFKNGSDPLSMYRTLTRGFGLMAPQSWMVPSQKYDVIHYIREAYLRTRNPSQFVPLDAAYLARLPPGDTRGPEPSSIEAWSAMDYGSSLTHTYEVTGGPHNFAYKGIAIRLDPGAGGVARGRHWMIFDTDTLRVVAAWSAPDEGARFIDWRGIQFNGEHQIHPRIVGPITYANSTGPGWAQPGSGSFDDQLRIEGRDGRRYGPLPRKWGTYHGLYRHGQQVVLSYSVGGAEILESPRLQSRDESPDAPLLLRTFNIGPRDHDLVLQIAELAASDADAAPVVGSNGAVVRFEPPASPDDATDHSPQQVAFDGNTHLELAEADAFDLTDTDFTITARLRTAAAGTIFALTEPGPKWIPNGQTFFVRGGRLCFDIGWVGVVTSRSRVDDGEWHNVAVTGRQSDHRVRLYVDGRLDAEGVLAPKAALPNRVVRIGFTAPDFPQPESYFTGELAEVRFYSRQLRDVLQGFTEPERDADQPLARWVMEDAAGTIVRDRSGHEHDIAVRRGDAPAESALPPLLAGLAPRNIPAVWSAEAGRLRLRIPKGSDPLSFTIWTAANAKPDAPLADAVAAVEDPVITDPAADLTALTRGGPAQWPQKLTTQTTLGDDSGPFAADELILPESNPWLAQVRPTGLDFFEDGRIAVCTWDGDVWLIESPPGTGELHWQRIATGLFQPLGLKIVNGTIHVICRDQLAALRDLNGDGEIDFYECLNNDHQVTEHFHEFAMGLQVDADGNFYYAKSGRHALPAVVPQHGTLLRISPDGARTDILATGFRAANGVCLNPDGSFVVTDQEGFWNPKNRINWVTVDPDSPPKFYGNMLGYTDVTDPSDSAMEPPLCWITNAFDRSPAELLWVESDAWQPLRGSLLNLSYGNGEVFLVPHEQVAGVMQGGMIELPLPAFPTGVMRGRFHPADGQLYVCGMFAWAGNATNPGGLYRIRRTDAPLHLPIALHAAQSGLSLSFTEPLDPEAADPQNVQIKTWSLRRTANYGSNHYDEQSVAVRAATLSADGRTLSLQIPDLRPTWCMEIRYQLRAATGAPVEGVIHNTIHALADES